VTNADLMVALEKAEETARLKGEIELARKIQTVLLPTDPAAAGYAVAARRVPQRASAATTTTSFAPVAWTGC
jgi:hypothetical protein